MGGTVDPSLLPALAAALGPVVLGLALALAPRVASSLELPARVLSVLAALWLVALAFWPSEGHMPGLGTLAAFLVALVGPTLAEKTLAKIRPEAAHLGLGLGFAGALLHQLVDGTELGAVWRLDAAVRGVTLAIGAHTVPLIAALTYAYTHRLGPRAAVLRGLALLTLTAVGVFLGQGGAELLPSAHEWLPAVVAGLLLHVVLHELGPGHEDHEGHGHHH